jgi:hypothetical protein
MSYAKNSSKVKMNDSHLNTLWKVLVLESPVEKDRKNVYDWLRDICDNFMNSKEDLSSCSAASIIKLEDLMTFFQKSILGSTS